jgi:hypothetical protein
VIFFQGGGIDPLHAAEVIEQRVRQMLELRAGGNRLESCLLERPVPKATEHRLWRDGVMVQTRRACQGPLPIDLLLPCVVGLRGSVPD